MKKLFLIAFLIVFANFSSALAAETAWGLAASAVHEPLKPYKFDLKELDEKDIQIEILYAGVCHSDIHLVNDEHGAIVEYPYVPGHEIVGRVSKIGKNEKRFKVGDIVGVGSILNSCGVCEFCKNNLEQYCIEGAEWTGGGYATKIIVNEKFAVPIPKNIPVESVAPLMCAGITVYSPLKQLGIKKGDKVAVAGMGGLGHLAVQYAKAMGADVTVFEVTDEKISDAQKFGAVDYLNTKKNPQAFENYQNKFDAIICTIPLKFELQPYIDTLKSLGTIVILGMPPLGENIFNFDSHILTSGGKRIIGSSIGGMAETEEMVNFSAKHKIFPAVEIISADKINEAFQKVKFGEVKFRYVIDAKTIK